MLLLFLAYFMVTTPAGQNFIVDQISKYAAEHYDVRLNIEGVNISFFDHLHIDGLYLEDHKRDTLAYIDRLDAGVWKLLTGKADNTLNLRDVKLIRPKFYLREYEGDSLNNMQVLINKLEIRSDTTDSKPFKLNINEFQVRNGRFIYDKESEPHIPFGMDWSHLEVNSIFMQLRRFHLKGDTVETDFKHFELQERSGFEMREFAGQVLFSPEQTDIQNFKLVTPQTELNMYLNFSYDSLSDYSDFVDKVRMNGEFYNSKVNFKDISYFAPNLEGWDDSLRISGAVRGRVSNLRTTDLDLYFGETSRIYGNVSMNGLPDIENTFINLDLDELRTTRKDLSGISIPPFDKGKKLPVPPEFEKMGFMRFRGRFTGFINDFVANGELNTSLGFLETDIKLAQDDEEVMNYSGKLKARDFEFGKLAGMEDKLGKVSLTADVKGKEFNPEHIDAYMKGTIHRLDLFGYSYRDIDVGGTFKDKQFSGDFNINDSNLVMDFEGDILLGDSFALRFTSNIKRVYPSRLKITDRDSSFYAHGKVTANFKGTSIDDILGRISIDSLVLEESEFRSEPGRVDFVALTNVDGKTLNLQSKNVTATLTGKFNFEKLPQAFNYTVYRIIPSAFEKEPEPPSSNERFQFELKLSKSTELTEVFLPDFKGPDTLDLYADFNVLDGEINIDIKSGEWGYAGTKVSPMNFAYNQSQNVASWSLKTSEVRISDSSRIGELAISGNAAQDTMGVGIHWDNRLEEKNFKGDLYFTASVDRPEFYKFNFSGSEIVIADTVWLINSKSAITLNRDTVSVNKLKLYNESQELLIDGDVSKDPAHIIALESHNFDLTNFNVLLNEFSVTLSGIMEGAITAQDLYGETLINSNLTVDKFKINDITLGDAQLRSKYFADSKKLNVNVGFADEFRKYIAVKGDVYPTKKDSVFDLRILMDSLPVKIVEPFTVDIIDRVSGGLSANLTLTGNIENPKLNGKMTLVDFETRVVYLNTLYRIERGRFFVMPDLIGADMLKIKDSKNRTANCNVSVFHENFSNINYDISIATPEGFEVLNTTEQHNDIFYGTAHIDRTSTVIIETRSGGKTQLTVNAGTDKNTNINLPLGDDSDVIETDYVRFITPEEREEEKVIVEKTLKSDNNFLMDFKLRVTPDANVKLIFDKTVGDIIEAEGRGDLTLTIDQNSDFSIYGTYEIDKGNYLFTLRDLINKRFTIKPGGTLTWAGDPLRGEANITAVYSLRTNLYDLRLPVSQDTNELKRRLPVDLLLTMTGNYLEPDFSFDFRLPDRYRDIQELLSNMEESEKNKQVFSLLILNKFVAYGGSGLAPGGGAIGNNSFEMLSNQLSNWLSGISNEFDIGVNYRPGDEISSEEVQVALSTQLLEDRITLETNVGMQGDNPAAQDRGSQFIGDFNVEYKISNDGRLRGKVFNRSNTFNPAYENQAPYTQGTGIAYTESFKNLSHLKCLIRRRFMSSEERRKLDCTEIERNKMNARENEDAKIEEE